MYSKLNYQKMYDRFLQVSFSWSMGNIWYLNRRSKQKCTVCNRNGYQLPRSGMNQLDCGDLVVYEITSAGHGCEVSLIQACKLCILV